MVAKSVLAFAFFAVSAQVAFAAPPACLLAGVNTQPSPGDIAKICTDSQAQVLKYINDNCAGAKTDAINAFSDACKAVGKSITISANATGTATGTSATGTASVTYSYGGSNATVTAVTTSLYYDQSCGCTKTAVIGKSTGFATATGSGSGSPVVTGSSRASGTGSSPTSTFTGAASHNIVGGLAAAAAVAGFAIAL